MTDTERRSRAETVLARLQEGERAKLRVYIGAAPGVGKTYQMLEDAHLLEKQGVDIVVGVVETHGRADTEELIGDIEQVPLRTIEYRGVTLEEMDVDAVIARKPQIAIVDELAHTNVPGRRIEALRGRPRASRRRHLGHHGREHSAPGIPQRRRGSDHRRTGPRDGTGPFLRSRGRSHQRRRVGRCAAHAPASGQDLRREKIEQSLNNFFRKGNLSALRELALRQVAEDQAAKAHDYREREGLEQAAIPEKVMVCMASRGSARKLLRMGSRIAGRFASDWFAVYVETPAEEPGRIKPEDHARSWTTSRLQSALVQRSFGCGTPRSRTLS